MENYSKITAEQLDLESLADYIVQSKNLVYRLGEKETSADTAQDVDFVAGIPSAEIAIAASPDDRYTVRNSLQLGGIPAEQYVTASAGSGILAEQEIIKNSYENDIKDLRDEFYQLTSELVSKGFLKNKGQYEGFIDAFEDGKYKNIQNKICDGRAHSSDDKKIIVDDVSMFDKYDFVCANNPANGMFDVKQIVDIVDTTVELDSPLRKEVSNGTIELYKSKGFIHHGLYKFAKKTDQQIGSEENHTGLSDDTYKTVRSLKVRNKGFGYSFRVPSEKQGFIISVEICAKAVGAPGAMTCYLINESEKDKFKNPGQAEKELSFFAKSRPYKLDASEGKRYLKFSMLQPDGHYPILPRDKEGAPARYILIVKAEEVDENNYYDVLFLQTKRNDVLGDLQLNNTTFEYTVSESDSQNPALISNNEINKADMYYHVVTKNIVENAPEAQKQGLYSAHISCFDLKEGLAANKARLMMRIKREGTFMTSVTHEDPVVYVQKAIPLMMENEDDGIHKIEDLRLKTDIYKRIEERQDSTEISEKVKTAIGSNIVKTQGFDDAAIVSETPALIRNGEKVYRVGYLVSIKAREVGFNKETGEITKTDYDHYVMPLTEVFKDCLNEATSFSDRLIFETEFAKDKKYNDFEIQVYWENRELSDYLDIKEASMGAIKDFVLSFTRGY